MSEPTYESNYIFPRRMLFFHANRSALLIRGLVFSLVGLIGLFHPIGSVAAITVILGIFLLLDAMGALFLAVACRRFSGAFWSLLLCVSGIAMIIRPVEADVLIAVVLGAWLIVTGVGELLSARVSPSRIILSGSGFLSILIGILLVVAPFAGLTAFSWLIALLLLISGVEMLILVFGLRVPGLSAAGKQDRDDNA